jgi:hypothetical protein
MSADRDSNQPPVATKPRTWNRWILRTLLIYVAVPYVAIVIGIVTMQRRMIYQPRKTERLLAESVSSSQQPVDDAEMQASEDLKLHGWHFHAAKPQTESKFLVLYFPGNAGCRADRILDCSEFANLGCDVVLFDYRGYGDNGGAPTETALSADARRAWQFAVSELHVPPDRIILYGESLGGAMATRIAAEFSQAGTPPAALVLNSVFASLGETVAWHYPAFPFQFLLLDRYPSVQRIPHIQCPLLQFHGTADEVVAFEHGRRLFEAAPDRSAAGIEKQFIRIPGGQHNFIGVSDMHDSFMELMKRIRTAASDTVSREDPDIEHAN